jgi:glycogen phosphorylase
MNAGEDNVRDAAAALARRLPEELAPLAQLSYNYRWSWAEDGQELFRRVDPERFALCGQNPVKLLQEASAEALDRAAHDEQLVADAERLHALVSEDLERPADTRVATPEEPVAFLCAEYGVQVSLPIYSGGLGALAGDILKEASDRATPLVAVGLLYRQGYFRQRVDSSGWQQEYWVDTDPKRLPAALVSSNGDPLTISVPIGQREVTAQIWRVDVGRVPLFLLDADRPENHPVDRFITSRLYVGDPELRLAQYVLLGVGGMRALRALGIEPPVVHLNEGHAAFASLEVEPERIVFTTHTPVPAGNDTYPPGQLLGALSGVCQQLGLDPVEILNKGRTHPGDDNEPFGVTQFALRNSRAANGVARRHGEVARGMWHALWPDRDEADVPIGHVTNGVHLPTWVGRPMRTLFDRYLGDDWTERATDPGTWAAVRDIPAAELWAARREQRRTMVDMIRERSVALRVARGDDREFAEAAATTFDPDVLTIGFARRLATYKRLALLVHDPERAARLLTSTDRPVQIVLAGKAHPKDDDGKRLVQRLFELKHMPGIGGRVVFVDDYDLDLGAVLTRGCDVWLNLPRPPLEASGTSGMKNAANGGLQLSVLDGWWPEAYDGDNGWALSGDVDPDHGAQDHRHAGEFYGLLENEVVPSFYDRGDDGLPHAWIDRMRHSLETIPPEFTAGRMVADYVERMYPRGARV